MITRRHSCATCLRFRLCGHTGSRWLCLEQCWPAFVGPVETKPAKSYRGRLPVSGEEPPTKGRYERERDARRQP